MKIVDCFIFYNEIDLLYYRLNVLNDVVDFFVIVESTHTFIGKEKRLFFNDHKELFQPFEDKIIHIVVDDVPYRYPNINIQADDQWKNEIYQRNQIKRGLEKIDLNEEDIIIVTDVDEIPNKNVLKKIKNNEIWINLNELEMDFYYYSLNHKKRNKWHPARILSYHIYKYLQMFSISFNDIRFFNYSIIENGGWHLSYFGDAVYIKNKIENFSHQEFNTDTNTNIHNINQRIENFSDVFGRDKDDEIIKIAVKDNTNLPPEYETYLQKFIHF
jgi:beta-1,4-mannosyl-glycoprotein beta-1,4-N-acetylglucosaminyltransferase